MQSQISTATTNKQPQSRRTIYALLVIMGLWIVLFASFAVLRHERLNSSAYDLAIKSQVIWNTFQGDWFASSIEVDFYLGDHVQFIMLLLAPLFGLWADVKILLIVQTILLGLAAIPVFRIASRTFATPVLPLLFALVYLLYPTVGFINRFGFHPISFVIFFLLMAYDLVEMGRLKWASLFVLLALLCREDVGFTVFAFGLYVAFVMKQRRLGLVWSAAGLVWSLTAIFVVIPHFRGADSDSLSRYGWLGDDLVGMATAVFTHPLRIINHFTGEPFRLAFLFKLLLPVGYLSLLAPLALLVTLPALTYNLLSETPSQSSIYFQYVSPVIPFIMISAIQGSARLQGWLPKKWPTRRGTAVLVGWLGLCILVAWALDNPFTTTIEAPYFPVYALEHLTDADAFHAAETLLPPEAEVATMMAYGPHLSLRPELHLFYDRSRFQERPFGFPQSEYLLLNLSDWRWGVNARVFLANLETAIGQFGYEAIFYDNDVVLLTQTGPQPATGAVLQRSIDLLEAGGKFAPAAAETLAWHGREWLVERLPETAVSTNIPFANTITLLGYTLNETELAAGRPLCLTLYWQTDASVLDDLTVFMHFTAPDGYVHAQRDSTPAQSFYPTSQWQPGEIIADMHCLQIPPHLSGEYGINIGLYNPNTGARVPIFGTQDDAVRITAVTVTQP